jgi:ABC-2 type transport system ATP-binding protein
MERLGIAECAARQICELSGGQQQRVFLARALLGRPQLLILDEPTVGIDPEGVSEMLELIRRLADERGVALLLSSHLLHQVQSVCDRVGIFVAGRMVAQGPMADLADHLAGGRVTLEVGAEGPLQEVEGRLRGLEHVITVLPQPRHPGIWVVRATADIRRQVAAIMTGGGVALTELRRVDQELDEIYRRYFAEEGHDGDA